MPRVPQISSQQPIRSIRAPRIRRGVTGQVARAFEFAGREVSILSQEALEREADLRQSVEVMRLSAEAAQEAQIFFAEQSADPDFRTLTERMAAGLAEIRRLKREQIADPEVDFAFQRNFQGLTLNMINDATRDARMREVDLAKATLNNTLDIFRGVGVDSTGAQLDAVAGTIIGSIRSQVAARTITEVEGDNLQRKIFGEIAYGKAIRDIRNNPQGAVTELLKGEGGKFADVDPLNRERLINIGINRAEAQERERIRKEEKAERLAEKARKQKQRFESDEAFDMAMQGELTLEELDQKRLDRSIVGEDFRRIRRIVEEQRTFGGVGDSRTFKSLETRILGGEAITKGDIAEHRGPEGLNDDEIGKLFRVIDQQAQGGALFADADYKEGLNDIKRTLQTTSIFGPFDTRSNQLLSQAIREYNDAAREEGLRPPEKRDFISLSRRIIDKFKPGLQIPPLDSATLTRLTTRFPSREAAAIAAERGDITESEANAIILQFEQIERARQREAEVRKQQEKAKQEGTLGR